MSDKKIREKTGGRKKGTPNKVTSETRDIVKAVALNNARALQEHLDALGEDHQAWIKNYLKILEFALPRLGAIQFDSYVRMEQIEGGQTNIECSHSNTLIETTLDNED